MKHEKYSIVNRKKDSRAFHRHIFIELIIDMKMRLHMLSNVRSQHIISIKWMHVALSLAFYLDHSDLLDCVRWDLLLDKREYYKMLLISIFCGKLLRYFL